MKKVVIVVILAVYLASIALVNFFGLKVSIFEGTTYVTEINVERVVLHRDGDGKVEEFLDDTGTPNYYFEFVNLLKTGTEYSENSKVEYSERDESIIANPNTFLIDYKVNPGNASNKNVDFVFSQKIGEEDNKVYLGVNGSVKAVFLKDKHVLIILQPRFFVDITLRATDGSNVSTSICVYATKPKV